MTEIRDALHGAGQTFDEALSRRFAVLGNVIEDAVEVRASGI